MRYTECRLHELAMRLLDGIDEQTVDFADNFDSTEHEPGGAAVAVPPTCW